MRDNDQAADHGRDAGYDQRIAEAEFVDRNAISDHRGADHDGNGAHDKQ